MTILSIKSLFATFSLIAFSITTLTIQGLLVTLNIMTFSLTKHGISNSQHYNTAIMLSVTLNLLLC